MKEISREEFIHLHVHTAEGSLLDGYSRIPELVARAKELNMPALAITDHGTMFGCLEFYKECKKNDIKPIIGCEVYLANRTMHDKEKEDLRGSHLILLCKNEKGYKNLIKLVSDAYTEGFYQKPKTDHNELRKHSEGLICLSACLAGKIQRLIVDDKYEEAKEEALLLRDIFGDDFYLELQNHYLPDDSKAIKGLLKLSEEAGIKYVCTNDTHYTRKEDADAQLVAMALNMKKKISDGYKGFESEEFYLKNKEEMRRMFASDVLEEAMENARNIASLCNFEFELGNYHIPDFDVPEGFENPTEYFEYLCREGFKKRYGKRAEEKALIDRLEMEISMIENMGYVEYFLIVWDFINYAKSVNIPVGYGRGSAVGSIVSYCLGITGLDPVKYNLFFERFLNPERVSMPDIDIDFCIERREEVIDYVVKKYGADRVSRIITFIVMKAKSAIKDVARYYEMDYAKADKITKLFEDDDEFIDSVLNKEESELRYLYSNDEEVKKVVDMAKRLEGLPRHASVHAAGVVIAKKSVSTYVPLYQSSKMLEPASQFTMTEVEELGLLKMDFLGLRNLTVIDNAIKMIKENYGVDIDLEKLPLDDKDVYEMLSKGKTVGVFQLEAKGITKFFKKLKPSCFEDIIAGVALYRPGPMDSIPKYLKNKNHPDKIKYIAKELEPIYEMTYGCLVYQEQVMQVLMSLAGYSLGQADIIRRAMSKKKKSVMEEHREYFINGKKDEDGNVEIKGCKANGIDESAAIEIWDDMASFAAYAFNKSHSAAYALITYFTAYLKYYYPVEFMAALMTSEANNSDHLKTFVSEAQRMRIKILSPNVLVSKKEFIAKDGKIIFGLDGIKNVGTDLIESIEAAQEKLNKMENPNIFSFAKEVTGKGFNKRSFISLVNSGACDSLIENRRTANFATELILENVKKDKTLKGQMSLFDEGIVEMPHVKYRVVKEYTDAEILQNEKEVFGFYLTKHPLDAHKKAIKKADALPISKIDSEILDNGSEESFTIAGILTKKKVITTKTGKKMAFLLLEDLTDERAVTVFSEVYKSKSRVFSKEGKLVGVRCHADYRRGDGDLIVEDIVPIEQIESLNPNAEFGTELMVKLRIENSEDTEEVLDIIKKYSGTVDVYLYIAKEGRVLKSKYKVSPTLLFLNELRDLLGRENVKYILAAKED